VFGGFFVVREDPQPRKDRGLVRDKLSSQSQEEARKRTGERRVGRAKKKRKGVD